MVFAIPSKKYLYQRKISVLLLENVRRQKRKLFYNLKDNFYGQISLSIFFVSFSFRYFNIQKNKLKIYDIKIFRI